MGVDLKRNDLLKTLLVELLIMEAYLSKITDEEIKEVDNDN